MSDTPSSHSADARSGMLCPHCRVVLMMADRQGIEIDFCPQCRGIWLDHGELDRIIERSQRPPQPGEHNAASPWLSAEHARASVPAKPDWHHGDDHHERRPDGRRESFFDRLFD